MEESFLARIQTGRGILEFNFPRIFTTTGIRYFITVIDQQLKSHLFSMEKINRIWTIIDKEKVPAWILEMEEKLEAAIMEQGG